MTGPLALVLRHAPEIGLGNVAATLASRGYRVETVDTPGAELARLDPLAPDVVVVLGGEEGAHETEQYPYLAEEIAYLRRRTEARRPVLGICLGAQLLAPALGASAWRGPVHEVGFVPIEVLPAGEATPLRHVAGVPMAQWHHDTFAVPEGAELLARTADYPQAYRIGSWLLAVQFHPEVDEAIHADWVERWAQEVRTGVTAAELTRQREQHLARAEAASRAMVGEWLDGLG